MIQCLKDRSAEETIFGYVAYSATHWPLQCLLEDRDLHKGKYDVGPDALREKRWKRLIEPGLIKEDVFPHPVVALGVKESAEMSSGERKMSARAM